jgi:soluble lytic murein transglycosylase-like protein
MSENKTVYTSKPNIGRRKLVKTYHYAVLTILCLFITTLLISGLLTMDKLNKCGTENIILRAESNQWRVAYNNYYKTDLSPTIKRLQPKLDRKLAERISSEILKYSSEYRLPPNLVIHVMNRESGFRPLITSKAGALGLMQVIPKWHEEKLKEMKINNNEVYYIENNIKLGCWILREYFDQEGDIEKALKKYVGGSHDTYIKDILIGFANEAIVGAKNVQGVPEIERREQDVERENEHERSGKHEEEVSNSENGTQPVTVDKRLGTKSEGE